MTDDRLPWFPCYPSKLLGALAQMRPAEGYVYTIMLLRIYESGGRCADSLDAISKRTGYTRRVVSEMLDLLFRSGRLVRVEAGISNPVAEVVMAESRALHDERKSAGREGGLRSAEKRKANQSVWSSKAAPPPQQNPTHLQLHKDSRFPNGNLADAKNGELFPSAVEAKPGIGPSSDPETELFRRGKEVLGKTKGGVIVELLKAKGRNVAKARAVIEEASTKHDPMEYVKAATRRGTGGTKTGRGGAAGVLLRRRREGNDGQAGEIVDV